ncbi:MULTISPECIES: lipocalin family protein [Flavobacterium]|uniref:lipocalin family protein n=1 Tax=Flavobacterium TaxID=237 RepID=UPI00188B64AF|nr:MULTISPECIES: lipocalin family protein [Flavobacterium]MBF4470350.1 lipocalin family protein [Flavobacterium sp. HJJ]
MRKILLICAMAIMVFACKSGSTAPTAPAAPAPVSNAPMTKLDKASQVGIKGDWQIVSVTYPGSDYIKVNSFNLADSKCFIGSTWHFISNNNKGTMTLNSPNCTAFTSAITWYINKEGQFVLKILDEGLKSKNVKTGFVLAVRNQSETSFELVDKINVGSKPTDVVYLFQKAN